MSTADSSAPPSNTNGTDLKNALVNNAAAAVNTVQNHPITQNVVNGPVATSIKNQAGVTANEFGDLAASRQPPSYTAANNTELTHYHSFFYTLLSWKNKRATGITFAAAVFLIFAGRYLPILRYLLKITWMTLGVVTLAEASSKLLMGSSVASAVRPRKYYKIPKEALESSLDDLENLINFFVIEGQRIVFAENIPVTAAGFLSAFLTYYLIKLLPFWGMSLLSTCVIFLGPLVYLENQELIDGHLQHAGHLIGEQTNQIKDLTAQHTSAGFESVKQYTGTYAAKAQEMVGSARQKIPSPTTGKAPVNETDFPTAPKTDFSASSVQEPSFGATTSVHEPSYGATPSVQEPGYGSAQYAA